MRNFVPLFRCAFGAYHQRTHGCDCLVPPNPAEELLDPYPQDDKKYWTPRMPLLGSETQSTWNRKEQFMDNYKVEFYQREDDRWAWRIVHKNGNIIATDGGQGYENLRDAFDTVHNLSRGFSHEVIKGFVAAGGTA